MKYGLKIFFAACILLMSSNYAQKSFGIGIILGEPTGLSAKLWTGSSNAFDFGAAWSFEGSGHFLFQADYVWHSSLSKASSGGLAVYYGIGGRIVFANKPNIGVRLPIGLDYIFSSAPIDIFLEVVPAMDLIPSTDFDLNGGLGIRFWF